jgi:hypothetical protein
VKRALSRIDLFVEWQYRSFAPYSGWRNFVLEAESGSEHAKFVVAGHYNARVRLDASKK